MRKVVFILLLFIIAGLSACNARQPEAAPAANEPPALTTPPATYSSEARAGESRFGVQGAIVRYPGEMRDAGVEITREWIDWQELEPVRGRYNWAPMDKKVSAANQANIAILGYFIHMPAWAKKEPRAKGDFCKPEDIADFRRLARDVAERYDGHHGHGEMKYIEILNEVTVPEFYDFKNPDNSYELWLVNGYQGIKEGNPNAEVLIGGLFDPLDRAGNPPQAAVLEFIKKMARDYSGYYDIMNVHSYSEGSGGVTRTVRWLKSLVQKHGDSKPLWITETSTLFGIKPVYDQEFLARELIKRYVRAFGEGVEKVFWFPFVGLPIPQEEPEHGSNVKNIGLGWDLPKRAGLVHSYHPRRAHYAYQVMTSKLCGFSSAETIAETQYKFIFPDRNPVFVLWRDAESLPLPAGITGRVKVTDYLGNEEAQEAAGIVLTANPIFLE